MERSNSLYRWSSLWSRPCTGVIIRGCVHHITYWYWLSSNDWHVHDTYPGDVDPGERLDGGRERAAQLGDLRRGPVLASDQDDLVGLGERCGHLRCNLKQKYNLSFCPREMFLVPSVIRIIMDILKKSSWQLTTVGIYYTLDWKLKRLRIENSLYFRDKIASSKQQWQCKR